MQPDQDGRSRPDTNGAAPETPDPRDETNPHLTANSELAEAFESAVIGGLLCCSADDATVLLADLDAEMFSEPLRWAFRAINAAVTAGVDPTPLAAADAARVAGIARPPAWSHSAVSELTALAVSPAAPALPMLGWHCSRLAAYAAQRAAQTVMRAALDALDRTDDLAELAAVLRQQADRLQALAGAR